MGLLQLRSQEAQINLMNAQAEKAKAEAKKTGGVDTKLGETKIESLTQGIKNQKAVELLTKTEQRLKEAEATIKEETIEEQIATIGIEMQLANKAFSVATRNDWIDENTKFEKIKLVKNQLTQGILENALIKSKTASTRQNWI